MVGYPREVVRATGTVTLGYNLFLNEAPIDGGLVLNCGVYLGFCTSRGALNWPYRRPVGTELAQICALVNHKSVLCAQPARKTDFGCLL